MLPAAAVYADEFPGGRHALLKRDDGAVPGGLRVVDVYRVSYLGVESVPASPDVLAFGERTPGEPVGAPDLREDVLRAVQVFYHARSVHIEVRVDQIGQVVPLVHGSTEIPAGIVRYPAEITAGAAGKVSERVFIGGIVLVRAEQQTVPVAVVAVEVHGPVVFGEVGVASASPAGELRFRYHGTALKGVGAREESEAQPRDLLAEKVVEDIVDAFGKMFHLPHMG